MNGAQLKQLLVSALKELSGEADGCLARRRPNLGREDFLSHLENMQQQSCQIVELFDLVRIL